MLMNVLQRKRIRTAFLCVKTDRNPLNDTDIVDRTFLVKVGKRNVMRLFIDLNRRNRRRYFLYQRKAVFKIFLIRTVNIFFQCRAAQAA